MTFIKGEPCAIRLCSINRRREVVAYADNRWQLYARRTLQPVISNPRAQNTTAKPPGTTETLRLVWLSSTRIVDMF